MQPVMEHCPFLGSFPTFDPEENESITREKMQKAANVMISFLKDQQMPEKVMDDILKSEVLWSNQVEFFPSLRKKRRRVLQMQRSNRKRSNIWKVNLLLY